MPNEANYRLTVWSRRGQLRAELNEASSVNRSYAISRSATLTFSILVSDPKATEENLRRDNVVLVESLVGLPTWKGYITDTLTVGDTITVTAQSTEQKLGRRRLGFGRTLSLEGKTAGYIVSLLVDDANSDGHTGISKGELFMGGKTFSYRYTADKIYETLSEVVEAAELDYRVEHLSPALSLFHLYERWGRDLTDTVVVGEWDLVGDPEWAVSNSNYANKIIAVGDLPPDTQLGEGEDEWAARPKAVYTDPSVSDENEELSEDVLECPGVSDLTTLLTLAKAEASRRKHPIYSLHFRMNNARSLWALFEPGDTICIQKPFYAFTGMVVPFRVLGYEVDEETSTLTVAGEVVVGERAASLAMYTRAHYGSGAGRIPMSTSA